MYDHLIDRKTFGKHNHYFKTYLQKKGYRRVSLIWIRTSTKNYKKTIIFNDKILKTFPLELKKKTILLFLTTLIQCWTSIINQYVMNKNGLRTKEIEQDLLHAGDMTVYIKKFLSDKLLKWKKWD